MDVIGGVFILVMLLTSWACYFAVPTMRRWRTEKELKPTLDDLGMTLEQASDKHYDGTHLEKIRAIHSQEHVEWQRAYSMITTEKWLKERFDHGTRREPIRTWSGQALTFDDDEVVEYEDDEEDNFTITHHGGMTHTYGEVCYKCDNGFPEPKQYKKRQRRNQ